jgi:hypothetical protein
MSDQRRGKIARLPRDIRDQLNIRLDDGQEADQILPWLNELPQARQVLTQHFNGAAITAQNLSAWRQGGFQEWLLHQEFLVSAERACEHALELNDVLNADASDALPRAMADGLVTHLTVRLAAFATMTRIREPNKSAALEIAKTTAPRKRPVRSSRPKAKSKLIKLDKGSRGKLRSRPKSAKPPVLEHVEFGKDAQPFSSSSDQFPTPHPAANLDAHSLPLNK